MKLTMIHTNEKKKKKVLLDALNQCFFTGLHHLNCQPYLHHYRWDSPRGPETVHRYYRPNKQTNKKKKEKLFNFTAG